MKILLITPPLLQPNTPYPATPMLTAWLRSQGHAAVQADLSLELLLMLFSTEGLTQLFQTLEPTASGRRFLEQADAYLETIEPVVAFLQGKTSSLNVALPEGPHLQRAYEQEEQLGWNFRGLDDEDRARHLCSLYLDDVAEAFRLVDPAFGFSRYAEHLSSDFPMLGKSDSFIFQCLEKLTDEVVKKHQPELVVLTVPFPGCLAGALAIARCINRTFKGMVTAVGGGYVNTELRELSDPRIFDYVDYICLDSGMIPLLRLANGEIPVRTFVFDDSTHSGLPPSPRLRRTSQPPLQRRGVGTQQKSPPAEGCAQRGVGFYEDDGTVVAHDSLPAPTFDGLPLDRYFGLFEMLNPVTRLWSDGRWNKLMLAYGCCWRRCAFCDTSVDYVCRYDPATPQTACDWMESMMAENCFNGFHFVDEALPPDLLDGLCDEILKRGLDVEWWGNIRFEKRFSKQLIEKMARAGCIAVTGGLETCCDRTLKLMRKGITVEGASGVIRNFAEAGILTHAYLMVGFPTQTRDEIFQGLETVRGLLEEGALHSVYWHRFALTAHSEIARNPQRFGIRLLPEKKSGFARNEIPFETDFDYDPESVGAALRAAAYNYNLGLGFEV
ncbi:MAG TPA: radical SAM protein, partial [Tichowtungia sp.]|nr:radical SAM protein [Tichowtungia sp.]